jgi:two-component system, chemotaxis family, sensor kinase CheA
MLSSLDLNKYKGLVLALLLFVAITTGVLLFNSFITRELNSNAALMKIANSQQATLLKISKSFVSLQHDKRDGISIGSGLTELMQSIAQFDKNLLSLKQQGTDYRIYSFGGISPSDVSDSIAATDQLWRSYRAQLNAVTNGIIETLDEPGLTIAATQSKSALPALLDANEKTLAFMERAHDVKIQCILWAQILALLLVVANVTYILFRFLRQLSLSDQKIDKARREASNILNTVDEGLLLLDADGKTGSQMSQAAHKLFGRTIEAGEDFRELISRLVSPERAEEIKIYVNLLYDPKVKPALLVQLDPMKEVEVTPLNDGNTRFLSFKLRQLQQNGIISGLLVTVLDITDKVQLTKELANVQSEAHLDLEDLLRVFEQDPATMNEFLTVSRRKLSHLNEAMRTVSKNASAYKSLVKSTSVVIHGIKGESTALRLLGVSRQAHTMENAMAGLLERNELKGEDLIPVAYELSKVQEQVARIQRLFKRISGSNPTGNTANTGTASKSSFESNRSAEELSPHTIFPVTEIANNLSQPPKEAVKHTAHLSLPALQSGSNLLPSFSLVPTQADPLQARNPSANIVLNQPLSDLAPLTMLFIPSVPPLQEMAENLKKLAATVAQATGKNVLMTHEIAPIDPSGLMLRVLREVLPQLVRNSVVHGLEAPEDRLKLGKPIQGQLKLVINMLTDSMVQISLRDDGRGITLDSVKARLHEMNIDTSAMSNGQIMQHIFDLQFSTTRGVTEHAGRGVGLALVKESLEKAGGKLKVNTRPGQSTEFLINLENAA